MTVNPMALCLGMCAMQWAHGHDTCMSRLVGAFVDNQNWTDFAPMLMWHAASCSNQCQLVANPNQFDFQFAYETGRVLFGMPPLGFPPTWQLQVRVESVIAHGLRGLVLCQCDQNAACMSCAAHAVTSTARCGVFQAAFAIV